MAAVWRIRRFDTTRRSAVQGRVVGRSCSIWQTAKRIRGNAKLMPRVAHFRARGLSRSARFAHFVSPVRQLEDPSGFARIASSGGELQRVCRFGPNFAGSGNSAGRERFGPPPWKVRGSHGGSRHLRRIADSKERGHVSFDSETESGNPHRRERRCESAGHQREPDSIGDRGSFRGPGAARGSVDQSPIGPAIAAVTKTSDDVRVVLSRRMIEAAAGKPMIQMKSLVSKYKHDAPASEFSKITLAGASCFCLSRRHNRNTATSWLVLDGSRKVWWLASSLGTVPR